MKKYPNSQRGAYFMSKAVQLVQLLFDIIFSPGMQRLTEYVQDIFMAIIGVVNCVFTAPPIIPILESLASVVELKALSQTEKLRMQGYVEGLAGTIMPVVVYATRSKIECPRFEDYIKVFYNFAIQQCEQKDIGYSDGLMMLPTLTRGSLQLTSAAKLDEDPKNLAKIIDICDDALRAHHNPEIMLAGIETVGYLCLVYPHKMASHVEGLFKFIVSTLQTKDLSRKVRCQVLSLAGNLSIANRAELSSRIGFMLDQVRFSFETVVAIFSSPSTEADKHYAKNLRRAAVEFLMYTVNAICFQPKDEHYHMLECRVREFIPLLFEFVHRMLDEDMEPDVPMIEDQTHLILDMAQFFEGAREFYSMNTLRKLKKALLYFSTKNNTLDPLVTKFEATFRF